MLFEDNCFNCSGFTALNELENDHNWWVNRDLEWYDHSLFEGTNCNFVSGRVKESTHDFPFIIPLLRTMEFGWMYLQFLIYIHTENHLNLHFSILDMLKEWLSTAYQKYYWKWRWVEEDPGGRPHRWWTGHERWRQKRMRLEDWWNARVVRDKWRDSYAEVNPKMWKGFRKEEIMEKKIGSFHTNKPDLLDVWL